MPKKEPFTVRLDEKLKQKLEALAASTQRSKNWLAEEAITEFVERESWQIQQIEAAVQKADSSEAEWTPHEEVFAEVDQMIEEAGY
ncbi:MAG: CopG family ribbon-helix-helix protein [Xenococcus sp. (in: cyanobacteria)]